MVLLTMTPAIVAGLETMRARNQQDKETATAAEDAASDEPSLGKPITHGQVMDLWKQLRETSDCSLEKLLHGSQVYIPPPPPKPEPSPQYKALMARLRREEEARSYERMVNPPARLDSFTDRFPHAQAAYAEVNRPSTAADVGDDEVTYNDVHRQVMLIINFMVSIAGVAGTLWVLARWWSLPARLFLTMGGSVVVGIAEVVVYSVYVWRLGEAKTKQGALKEVKEVVQTWVVGEDDKPEEAMEENTILLKEKDEHGPLRKRNPVSTPKT